MWAWIKITFRMKGADIRVRGKQLNWELKGTILK